MFASVDPAVATALGLLLLALRDCGLEVGVGEENLERRVPMPVAEHEIVLHGACDDCSD